MCLILKIYHNFESYQNMLITLDFFFLYHKLPFCFVSYAHYTLFTCGKGLLKIWKFEKYFKLLKISIPYLWNCECFLNVCNRLLLPTIFYHQNYIITIILYLVLCKINYNLMQHLFNKHLILKPMMFLTTYISINF